jgi:hypothetical protein
MTYEQIIVFLTIGVGLSLVVAFVWWQNERDLAPIRKARKEADKK